MSHDYKKGTSESVYENYVNNLLIYNCSVLYPFLGRQRDKETEKTERPMGKETE